MGIDTLYRKNPSRRDDLQALAHTLILFSKGRLPWQDIPAKISKEKKRALVQKIKESLSPEELCEDLDPVFGVFTTYVNSLGFMEDPDYAYMKDLFLSYLKYLKVGLNYGWLDWVREPVEIKKKGSKKVSQKVNRDMPNHAVQGQQSHSNTSHPSSKRYYSTRHVDTAAFQPR